MRPEQWRCFEEMSGPLGALRLDHTHFFAELVAANPRHSKHTRGLRGSGALPGFGGSVGRSALPCFMLKQLQKPAPDVLP